MFKHARSAAVALLAVALAMAPIGAAYALDMVVERLGTSGSAPVLSSCGTSPTIVGTDLAGRVTMGTGSPTGCVITFNKAKAVAPACNVTWAATPLASQSYAVSTTAITLTQTGTSSNVVFYTCVETN